MLDETKSIACAQMNVPFMAAPMLIAKTATINAATVACTCTKAILPIIMWTTSRFEVMLPKFACVERRDARHMSKLPLSPNSAGTSMNNSLTCANTFQCYVEKEEKIEWNGSLTRDFLFSNSSEVGKWLNDLFVFHSHWLSVEAAVVFVAVIGVEVGQRGNGNICVLVEHLHVWGTYRRAKKRDTVG